MTIVNFMVSSSLKKGQESRIVCIRVTALTTNIDGSVRSVLWISKNHLVGQLDLEWSQQNNSCMILLDVHSDGL